MDAGLLDVLHDAADEHARPVGHGIDVDLDRVVQELVDQDRMLGRDLNGLVHELAEVLVVVDDPHRAAAQHVGGPDEHRVADLDGDHARLVEGAGGGAVLVLGVVHELPGGGCTGRRAILLGGDDEGAGAGGHHRAELAG